VLAPASGSKSKGSKQNYSMLATALIIISSALKMETVSYIETSRTFYRTIRPHSPEYAT
jgi:hypothetical protein